MDKRWIKKKYSGIELSKLINNHSLSRPTALALATRGVTSKKIDEYFQASLSNLTSPYRIPGMKQAAQRIWSALRNDENILVHGDFDVDGVTASALLTKVLTENGAKVSVYIPQRFDSGYGFSPESLEKSYQNNPYSLLITVDCGITSNEAVEKAKEYGVDVIITDHHEPGEEIPDAFAVLNPKVNKETEDLNYLAGVGMAFKLADAFLKYGMENNLIFQNFDLTEILDLAALGTIADIVPLIGENRILAKNGIKVLSKQIRPGIRSLCEISNIDSINSNKISYKLAPHINAAGRLGDPMIAYELLVTNSIVDANKLAGLLKQKNLDRRCKESAIFDEVESQIYDKVKVNDHHSILVYGENWHQGIIGNVASRISRDHNRPSIVLTVIDGEAYGSGRSTANINLVEILTESSDILNRYGGHPMAVGLSLDPKNIPLLAKRFEEKVKEQLSKESLVPSIEYEGDIFISEISDNFFEELSRMEPFGYKNEEPVYRITNLQVPYLTTAGKFHSRGYVKDVNNHSLPFIIFNVLPGSLPPAPWNVLTTPQLNEYYNYKSPQLRILDVKSVNIL